jgi:hypothetical protein
MEAPEAPNSMPYRPHIITLVWDRDKVCLFLLGFSFLYRKFGVFLTLVVFMSLLIRRIKLVIFCQAGSPDWVNCTDFLDWNGIQKYYHCGS